MDAMQWQIIENKAKFIEQVRKGDIKTRVIEDIEGEAANAGAMKAAASGNPLILEEMALKKQLNDLDSDKTRHDREQHRIKATIKRTKDGIDSLENEQSRYTTLSQAKTPSDLDITINGKNYKQGQEGARVEAGKAIVSQAIKASMSKEKLSVGQYGDFTISATANPTNRDSAILSLDYRGESIAIEVKHNDPAGGIITKLINRIKEIPDKLQQLKADLEKSIKAIPKLESQLKPWGKEAELDDIRRKHTEVMDALKPKKEEQAQPTDKPQYSKRELLAPNGKPSNLTPEQYAQVRTKEFKAWFGDWENDPDNASKFVNEKTGEPLVLYHGSPEAGFSEFNGGQNDSIHFTNDIEMSAQYSGVLDRAVINDSGDESAGIYAVFLNAKNPLIVDWDHRDWNYAPELYYVNQGGKTTIQIIDDEDLFIEQNPDAEIINSRIGSIDELATMAQEEGYDAVLANNLASLGRYPELDFTPGINTNEYVVFESNQIKSATNNTGAFDPNNDDIRYSKNTKGATDTTPTQVRDTLVKQFGEKTIKALEDAGVLHIKQLSDFVDENGNLSIADDAEGFFHDGKAVLIADNIDANQIVPVFLHEVGGHAGLQNMLSPNAYANLMQTFNAMVARGDEIALRAKARAELASENQDQATTEYLPYLLSEISNAQAKTPFIKRLLDRFVGAVRAWVYAKTGVRMNLTHADILGLAELTINERARNIERTAKLIKQVNKQYSKHELLAPNGKPSNLTPAQFSKQTPQTEIDQVRKQYEGTDQWMKAPNGKPTNLTEKQWLQVRTPSFKAWFGDWENDIRNASEIIDRNGEPLVVRHFTNKGFTVFDNTKADGFWFTDKKELDDEVGASGIGDTIEVFLNIRNSALNGDNYYVQEYLEENDADGIENRYEGFTDYAVTNPNQIKSATDNIGTFDPNNDDIRYSKNTKGATDTTPTQVRDTLVKQFGEKTIKALEDAGVLHIKQLSDFVDENGNLSIADDAEGFFHDGKAVLIADNIDANQIVPVFLHEVGGHAGLQNMLSPNAYANLMQTFNAMVARGDEIALRAKARAELASENQDQATTEYLPYLLSEISNAQAKTPFIKRLLDRFVGAVRAWVYAKTGVRMNLTHADILGLAELTINERARNIERTAKLIKQANKQYSQPATNQSISYSRRFAPIQQSPIPNKPAAKKAADWLNLQWATKWVSWDTFARLIRRNIATPQHVAITHADYKKFWDLVQQRINYTNYEAANAVGLVPEILDKRLIIGQNKKDIEAVSKVIFDGTMNDVVYGDTELTRKGLTDKQIDLYRRVRQAIDESVEKMAIDVLANSAKGTGLISLDEILRIKEAVLANGGNIAMFNNAMQQAVNAKIQAMLQAGVIDATKAGKLTTMFNEVAKQMDDVENRVYDLQDKGYAPLMRFGSYAVAVNDSKGDLVLYELYETKREQQKALHDLKKNPDYAGMTFNQNVLNPGDYQQFTNKGLNPETVMLFANELGLSSDEANQAYLKVAIAQQSALKRLIHRKKVAGFSEDLPRVLSAFVMSNARHSSRMLYNGDIQKAQQAIKDGDLRGEAQNLFENMENPKEEFASFRSMMFHWNMGFSPAFGLLNMTQPFIQTIPQLTMYDGVIGAHKSVLNGIRKAMASQVLEDAKGLGIAKNAKDFVDTIPSYMRDDYIRMTKEGHLDPQNVWLLQGLERGKAGVASGALGMVGQAAGYISEATETINRRATMYAALEIAHKLGAAKLKAKGFDSAYDFAVTTIQQTQGVYNKGNRSGLARSTGPASKFGAVIMMYKQFSINLIEQQIRMGQQKQGKALATAWVYQWLIAGSMGLIAADDLKDLIETIAFKFGYALNSERKIQEFFINSFGKEQGNDFYQMFNYGVLSSVSPIDFHGRSSAGNIIPATGLLHPSKAGDQKTEATEALGVGANWIGSMFDAGKLMMNGQFRDAMVTAAPRYIRDSVQAYEIATTGSMRDKNGRKVMDMTQGDAVAKALQFNPKSNAQRGREAMSNWQDKKLIENVKGDFTVKLAEAMASKDQAAQDKVMADIDKWNAKNDKQYQMDKTKITKSATDKAKKRDFTADERQTMPKSLEEYVNSLKKTG